MSSIFNYAPPQTEYEQQPHQGPPSQDYIPQQPQQVFIPQYPPIGFLIQSSRSSKSRLHPSTTSTSIYFTISTNGVPNSTATVTVSLLYYGIPNIL